MVEPFISYVELVRDRVDDFDDYPFSIPAIGSLTTLELNPQVSFFVGENGTGKSTLLEAIAVAAGFNAEGGTRNFDFATRESHSKLYECMRLVRGPRRMGDTDGFFFRGESFFNVATMLDQDYAHYLGRYGDKSLHEQSHGESFFSLVLNRFGGNGLYLLDEPESALSPSRQLAFLVAMRDLIKQDSQFIIATHSPILMAFPGATIYVFDGEGIRKTPYEETEHYKVTKTFLERKEAMLAELFDENA